MGVFRSLAVGMFSTLPGAAPFVARRLPVPEPVADYAIALKHLTLMQGVRAGVPGTLIELGPGASLGVGVVALLLGARRYVALDIERHVGPAALQPDRVLTLARLIRDRAPLRNADGFPSLREHLDATGFPRWLAQRLDRQPLDERQVEKVLACVAQLGGCATACAGDIRADYVVPWNDGELSVRGVAADAVLSHAVLQHAPDPEAVHRSLARFLDGGAVATHQIAYNAHRLSASWNGHWQYGDRLWALMRGRRRYLLNRLSHSQHVSALAAAGFETVAVHTNTRLDGVPRNRLAVRFRSLPESDLVNAGSFLVLRLRRRQDEMRTAS